MWYGVSAMTILKMDPTEYSVSAEYVSLLLEVMERRGISEQALLADTDIELGCWRDPKVRITATDFRTIASRAIALTGEPWLGWELGAGMTISSHGFLGYAAMSSATLGDALELAVKYFRTRSTMVQLETFTDGDTAVLQVNELLALGDLAPLTMESLFSSFHFMGHKLVPDMEVVGELRFSYPEPDYFERLRPVMPVDVYFDCAYNQMRFPVERMSYPLQFADPRLARMAADQCEQEMASIKAPPALLGQVRRIILGGSSRFPGVEEVASDLHMSSRTLKRKLQQLGTSYQEILDGLRKGLAVEYLTQTDKTVDEIAMSLGYSDASNFARAFRDMPPVVLVALALTGATLSIAPLALWQEGLPHITRAETWASLLMIGFVLTSAAFIAFYWLLPKVGPTNISTVTLIAPVSALVLGTSVLGETLLPEHLVGMAAIFAGLLLIDGRIVRRWQADREYKDQPKG